MSEDGTCRRCEGFQSGHKQEKKSEIECEGREKKREKETAKDETKKQETRFFVFLFVTIKNGITTEKDCIGYLSGLFLDTFIAY